jgi:hypothetical protein
VLEVTERQGALEVLKVERMVKEVEVVGEVPLVQCMHFQNLQRPLPFRYLQHLPFLLLR